MSSDLFWFCGGEGDGRGKGLIWFAGLERYEVREEADIQDEEVPDPMPDYWPHHPRRRSLPTQRVLPPRVLR